MDYERPRIIVTRRVAFRGMLATTAAVGLALALPVASQAAPVEAAPVDAIASALPERSTPAQHFGLAVLREILTVAKSQTDLDRAKLVILPVVEHLEAAVRTEHGAEADAIIRDGYQLAREALDIAARYWGDDDGD